MGEADRPGSPGPDPPRYASRLPAALLSYSIALAAFLIVPPYLKASVGPPQAFTLQEAADLLTERPTRPVRVGQ